MQAISDPVRERLRGRLAMLYGETDAESVLERILAIAKHHRAEQPYPLTPPRWTAGEAILITYGDTLQRPGATPLRALKDFLDRRLRGAVSMVHVLPFFPFSSDDGFAVSDFRSVNPALGDWRDIRDLSEHFGLLFDLVLNHMSREHLWFVNYLEGREPGRSYVMETDPEANLSMVVRPRNTPVLSRVRTPRGLRHVWATFSNDQIDLNYRNPDVLLEFIDTLLLYLRQGARAIRLDAVGYLWKAIGTSCIHLPQTHQIVKLLRDLIDWLEPGVLLLTETNVPHAENIRYFGEGDEAHLVYQFSLPPLLLHALHGGDGRYLTGWARDLEQTPLPEGCSYLNFTSSHDGIGVRPLEGLVPDEEVARLVETVRRLGGYVSSRTTSDGLERPYELNISYFDALSSVAQVPDDHWHVPRYLLAQTLPLSMRGIPAVYINALTATPNDHLGVERTGMTRSINRRKWEQRELELLIDNPATDAGRVFHEYVRRLRLLKTRPALHPEAGQRVLDLGPSLFAVQRTADRGEQTLLALHNLTADAVRTPLAGLPLRGGPSDWRDVLSSAPLDIAGEALALQPYQVLWLETLPD